jgi:hypothetical protein
MKMYGEVNLYIHVFFTSAWMLRLQFLKRSFNNAVCIVAVHDVVLWVFCIKNDWISHVYRRLNNTVFKWDMKAAWTWNRNLVSWSRMSTNLPTRLYTIRSFDSRWSHWIFRLIYSSQPHHGPEVNSASNRNEYQESSWGVKGGRYVRLTTSPPSVSRLSRENVGASTSHNPMGLHGLLQG